ncbi:hypothetical protein ACHAQH_008088, partial [Verticillium albo-atrum]
DLHIAKQAFLIPDGIDWLSWSQLVKELFLSTPRRQGLIDPRFQYGELRLSRLNKIHCIWKTPFRGYVPIWDQCGSFFSDNLAWIASSIVYVAVALTAMQVGLATEKLQVDDRFQLACYWFTILSLVGPLVAATLIFVAFLYLFINNIGATLRHRKSTRKADV